MANVKFSGFNVGGAPVAGDIFVGLRAGANTQFTYPSIGTIASQDANNVAITGGTIDGIAAGSTTAYTILNVDNLRLDANSITSTNAAGDIAITPDTTGDLILDGLSWPQADGLAGQVLYTDGAGQLGWANSPTVGGATTDNALARFDGVGGALQNSGVILSDTDAMSGITQLDVDNIRIDGNSITSTDAAGNLILIPDTTGNLVLDGLNWPQADGTANQVLATNGAGQISFIDVPVFGGPSTDNAIARFDGVSGDLQNSGVLIDDLNAVSGITQLDVDNVRIDGNSIVSTDAAGNLALIPNTTGDLVLDGLNWPQADGTLNQALVTDGAAQLSWASVSLVTTPTVDNTLARFDGVAGALQGSSVTLDDTDVMSGITQLNVDNLRLDGNTLSSTDVNGSVILDPNGTGAIDLNSDTVLVGANIQHSGDTDNQIVFGVDTQDFQTGGTTRLDLSDSGMRLGAANARVTTILTDTTLSAASDTNLYTGLAYKTYIDNATADLNYMQPARVATTGNLAATYNNGTAGVGATLTASANGFATIDTTLLSLNDRVLFKDQTTMLQNGIYYVSDIGSAITPAVYTRVTDFDQPAEIQPGDLVAILEGTVNALTSWIQTATVTTVGTDNITFVQFSANLANVVTVDGAQAITGAKTFQANVTLTGADLNLNGNSVDGGDLGANTAITSAQIDNINLDANAIISTSGNLALTPNGANDLVLDGLNWPQADGTAGQALTTNGAAQLGWSSVSTFAGASTDNAIARFDGVAGALQNSGVILSDLDGISGVTQLDVDNVRIDGNSIVSTDAAGNLALTPDTTGDLVLDGLNWPQADGTANQALITNGAAQLSWATVSFVTTPTVDNTLARFDGVAGAIQGSSVVLSDTDAMSGITQLDVDNVRIDGNSIVSTDAAGNLALTPDTTGDLVLDGLNWPQADGTANQALITNGAAQLSWATVSFVTTPTVDNTVARFDGVAGALQDSNVVISDTDAVSGITQLDVDNVRVDGNSIISTDAAGDLILTPNTTGDLVLDGLNWPQADGSANQALITNGSAQLSWATVSFVTTPTVDNTIARFDGVAGALQDSSITIDDADVLSGATQINVDNLRLDGNSLISTNAAGNILITPDTTGNLVLDGLNWPQADGTSNQALITNGAAQLSWATVSLVTTPTVDQTIARFNGVAGAIEDSNITISDTDVLSGATQINVDNLRLDGNNLTSTNAAGDINITPDTTGDLILDGLRWPQADGTAGQALITNGATQLSWTSVSTVTVPTVDQTVARFNGVNGAIEDSGVTIDNSDVVSGVTQLNVDNLRLDGNTIISTNAAGNISLIPDTTGNLVLDGLNWPQSDGLNGQVLKTNGAAQLSWVSVSTFVGASTDNALARYDGVSGALQNSSVLLDDSDAMSGITQLDVDNLRLNGNTIVSTDAAGNINITPDTTGDLVLDGLNWPQADGMTGQVLSTDGLGQLGWSSVANFGGPSTDNAIARYNGVAGALQNSGVIISDVDGVSGVTQLDVDNIRINGNAITSTDAAGNITITPDTTGNLVLDGLNWPQADGTAGSALITSGAGQLSFNNPGLASVQVFTVNGTWNRPSNIRRILVYVVGGGGGSGGTGATGGSQGASSGGGAGGGCAIELIDVTATSSASVTVGAGGTAGAAGVNTGGTGGTSSFGAFCSATGGTGGQGGTPTSGVIATNAASAGVGSGGDINLYGSRGGPGEVSSGNPIYLGTGGGSFLSGENYVSGGGGVAGNGYGMGGTGTAFGSGNAAAAGAAGAAGVVVVYEYK